MRQWVIQPLKIRHGSTPRLPVTELLQSRDARHNLRQRLEQVGDRTTNGANLLPACQWPRHGGAGPLAGNRPRDRRRVGAALAALAPTRDKGLPDVSALGEILSALVDEPPATLTEVELIRDGFNQSRRVAADRCGGKDYIARLQTTERERTGIASLKIGFNQVFGYYIEISKANLDKAPEEYHRKQTLTNAERFITPELKGIRRKSSQRRRPPQRIGKRALPTFARARHRLDVSGPANRPRSHVSTRCARSPK